ncbi:hypothetical protein ACOI1H_02645 [Loktanella sp. DJP18]|uniref:hypothetical protein n=1 Tax=Loktanella sp. DJP18 TaxID=3409788 RepID=UPI003BB48B34
MSMGRVWFIPWEQSKAGNFLAEASQGLSNSHHKRSVSVVCKDTPGKKLAELGFGTNARIHVAGHGSIGGQTLGADHGTGASDVTIPELVALLEAHGLKKYYVGTIVCDVCYSALGSPCFAKTFARALYDAGYKATCTMGYKGPLGAAYGDELGGKFSHRVVDQEDESGNVIATLKSKKMQERFWGFN